jgi:hypothetical protein
MMEVITLHGEILFGVKQGIGTTIAEIGIRFESKWLTN